MMTSSGEAVDTAVKRQAHNHKQLDNGIFAELSWQKILRNFWENNFFLNFDFDSIDYFMLITYDCY